MMTTLRPITPWRHLPREQKLQAIRRGYLDGQSNSQIGAAYGVSKNTIVALAWRWYLNADNAHGWKLGKCRPHPPNYERKRPVRRKVPMEVRRARLQNAALDPDSRATVAAMNALPVTDEHIADEMGVGRSTISNWRRGLSKVTPFMQQCVATLVDRLGAAS